MYTTLIKSTPYLLILIGLLLLFFLGMALQAGVCQLLGIVMVIEKLWPEKWEADKKKKLEL